MNEDDIENALKAMIGEANLVWDIAWPNQDLPSPAPQPRIEVNIDRVQRLTPTNNPNSIRSQGLLRINCIVAKGTSTSAATRKAQEVADLFNKGVSSAGPAGTRLIFRKAADVRAGFRDGSDWVVPVIGSYEVIPA